MGGRIGFESRAGEAAPSGSICRVLGGQRDRSDALPPVSRSRERIKPAPQHDPAADTDRYLAEARKHRSILRRPTTIHDPDRPVSPLYTRSPAGFTRLSSILQLFDDMTLAKTVAADEIRKRRVVQVGWYAGWSCRHDVEA
jgi:hypothetical protein